MAWGFEPGDADVKKLFFSFDFNDGWWYSCCSLGFDQVWSMLNNFVPSDYILVMELCAKVGQGNFHYERPEIPERLGLEVLSRIPFGHHRDNYYVVSKRELDKLSRHHSKLGTLQWVDCARVPDSESVKRIYTMHFRDDYFEPALVRALAAELGNKITFHSTGAKEIRIENRDEKLGLEWLRLSLSQLIHQIGLAKQIEIKASHIRAIVSEALPDRGPITLKSKDIELTSAGFKILFKGHRRRFVLEATGNHIEIIQK